MTRAVNLDVPVLASILALAALCGCAKPVGPRTAADGAVATTELSAANVEVDMPKVGKPQHAVSVDDDDKDVPRRERKPGGGFSGYK